MCQFGALSRQNGSFIFPQNEDAQNRKCQLYSIYKLKLHFINIKTFYVQFNYVIIYISSYYNTSFKFHDQVIRIFSFI